MHSVLISKLFDRVYAFDISSTIRLMLNAMLDQIVSLHVYTDLQSLHDCLLCINQSTKKRF